MKTKANPVCRVCGVELTDENWSPYYRKRHHYICKNCRNKQHQQWRKKNPEKDKAQWTRANHKRGQRPMSENKKCASFLGVFVAERVLSRVFKNVQRMPINNHGYDFICGKGFQIDVKSACKRKSRDSWEFHIDHNRIADHFLCLAFDNREDLNPLHIWLLPGSAFNHLVVASISQSTIHKWDAYRLDVTKVTACCNVMKSER